MNSLLIHGPLLFWTIPARGFMLIRFDAAQQWGSTDRGPRGSHCIALVYTPHWSTSVAFSYLHMFCISSYSLSLNQLPLLLIWFIYFIDYFTIKSVFVNVPDIFSTF